MIKSEFGLIDQIHRVIGENSRRVEVGIGDDAAVTHPPQNRLVTTVDMMVEGVHFDLSYASAKQVGYKALAINLSDLAAMGAEPLYALVSLGVSDKADSSTITDLYEGMRALLDTFEVDLIGGNVVRSPERLAIDICVIGEAKEQVFTRSGAQVGDMVAVTGGLGASAAGLKCLQKIGANALQLFPEATKSHLLPMPRILEALAMGETGGVHALIDISDGLASELHHIARSSKVGIRVDQHQIPILESTRKAAEFGGVDPLELALYGGEDYELLVTLDPDKFEEAQIATRALGRVLASIGEVVEARSGVKLKVSNGVTPISPRGWDHFK